MGMRRSQSYPVVPDENEMIHLMQRAAFAPLELTAVP
jgi:hypothetical protein